MCRLSLKYISQKIRSEEPEVVRARTLHILPEWVHAQSGDLKFKCCLHLSWYDKEMLLHEYMILAVAVWSSTSWLWLPIQLTTAVTRYSLCTILPVRSCENTFHLMHLMCHPDTRAKRTCRQERNRRNIGISALWIFLWWSFLFLFKYDGYHQSYQLSSPSVYSKLTTIINCINISVYQRSFSRIYLPDSEGFLDCKVLSFESVLLEQVVH